MKGIINIIEVMTVGIILLMALMFFFPRYSIKSKWSSVLLSIKVKDTLNTIDRMNKTFNFTKNQTEFENFMRNVFTPSTSGALIWWRIIQSPNPNFLLHNGIVNLPTPYFTEAQKETIIDIGSSLDENSVDSNTTGLWHFNEGSGSIVYDNTTNDNDGTVGNGTPGNEPTWMSGTNCKFGSCLKFDGINDVVVIPNSPSINFTRKDNYTVEAWVKSGTHNNVYGKAIVEKVKDDQSGIPYPYVLRYNGTLAYFGIWNGASGNQVNALGLSIGAWYHLAGVKDGNYIRIYVNGTLINSQQITIPGEIANDDGIYIGRRGNGGIPFNGTIDEVRISNFARTSFGEYSVYGFTLGLGYPY